MKRQRTSDAPAISYDRRGLRGLDDPDGYVDRAIGRILEVVHEAAEGARFHVIEGEPRAGQADWYDVAVECTAYVVNGSDVRRFRAFGPGRQGDVFLRMFVAEHSLRLGISTSLCTKAGDIPAPRKRARVQDAKDAPVDLDEEALALLTAEQRACVGRAVARIVQVVRDAAGTPAFRAATTRPDPDAPGWQEVELECDAFVLAGSDVQRMLAFPPAAQNDVSVHGHISEDGVHYVFKTSIRLE